MKLPDTRTLAGKLKEDVYNLCLPEGRMVGTEGHKVAENFLTQRLEGVGCVPYSGDSFEITYTGESYLAAQSDETDFTNLIGVIPGADRGLPPILVGAHYDSVIAAPCADDNGAAVAICLAIAEAANACGGLARDLVVAIFDAEEPPYFCTNSMGSNRFYADQLDSRGVHFALIYDLVGHDVQIPDEYLLDLKDFLGPLGIEIPQSMLKSLLFMTGAESHPDLSRIVTDAGVPADLKLVATLNDYVGDMSDHGVFRRNGIPYLFFSCGRWEHYHQVTDTPDRLNYEKMALIAQISTGILDRTAKKQLTGSSNEDHTLQFEIQKLEEVFGLALPLVLNQLGITKLGSRADVRKVASAVQSLGV